MTTFPQLTRDHQCDVVVMGGGITGALMADELSQHGHHVVIVERRDIGWGSTAASTALLQYEIDVHLTELAKLYGEEAAVRAYRACADAIGDLEALAISLGGVEFERQKSLYFASGDNDVPALEAELALRQQHDFKASWVTPDVLASRYRFQAPGAILTSLAASMDPYQMAYGLCQRVQANGGDVYDRTQVARLAPGRTHLSLALTNGATLKCRHLVIAAGYESQAWLPAAVATNRSSYACITDPLSLDMLGELNETMVWESARPYLYLRSTRDGRLLIGGDDDDSDIPARRDRRVLEKASGLIRRVEGLWPHLAINPTFSWAGTFAETSDGLPYFGPHDACDERVHFAMAYGGNGICYSMIGASLLRAGIEGRHHPMAGLFSFARHHE